MDYKDHIDNLTCEAVQSAGKALDYLDGEQLEHLEALLNDDKQGIDNWEERGVYPLTNNLTGKIVTRSALSYSKPPKRVVIGADGEPDLEATEVYLDLLSEGEFNSVMQSADQVARLLKNVIILVQGVEDPDGSDRLLFNILHRGNCDVDYNFKTGRIDSLMYYSGARSIRGCRVFHYWDPTKQVDIEEDGRVQRTIDNQDHDYKVIPAAVLWDTLKPRAGFWPKKAWTELIRCNEGSNLMSTEIKFAERYQAFPALFTNARLPNDAVIGPDSNVEIVGQPGETIYLEYKAATAVSVSLKVFVDWLQSFQADLADNWGVNLQFGGTGSASSGFQLIVEEVWNLETRRARLNSAKAFEERMYKVILAISEVRDLGLPTDSTLSVDFPEPELPVNTKENWTIIKEKIATAYMSIEDAWRTENPDITPDEIAKRKEEIGISVVSPSFGEFINAQDETV